MSCLVKKALEIVLFSDPITDERVRMKHKKPIGQLDFNKYGKCILIRNVSKIEVIRKF